MPRNSTPPTYTPQFKLHCVQGSHDPPLPLNYTWQLVTYGCDGLKQNYVIRIEWGSHAKLNEALTGVRCVERIYIQLGLWLLA